MTDHAKLAQLLFPQVTQTPQQLMEESFPPRRLKEGAQVTRFAPSPTGFLHIGGVFSAMVSERVAHTTGGVAILRIEDTDKKREVAGGVSLIVQGLRDFGIVFDEGALGDGEERGDYGPYTQSLRAGYYHVFCKDLVERALPIPASARRRSWTPSGKSRRRRASLPAIGANTPCGGTSPSKRWRPRSRKASPT